MAVNAINAMVAKGIIQLDADGLVDPDQANAAWGRSRRSNTPDDIGQRSAQSKVDVARARLDVLREKLERQRARYADRPAAIALARAEAVTFTKLLRQLEPGTLEPALMRRFVKLVMTDLGDLKRQAERDLERL